MAYRMRRWTGLRPSRASGRARPRMMLRAYWRKDCDISSGSSMLPDPPPASRTRSLAAAANSDSVSSAAAGSNDPASSLSSSSTRDADEKRGSAGTSTRNALAWLAARPPCTRADLHGHDCDDRPRGDIEKASTGAGGTATRSIVRPSTSTSRRKEEETTSARLVLVVLGRLLDALMFSIDTTYDQVALD